MNGSYEKRGAKMRKKKRNTIFSNLLALCLTVALILVTPQSQQVQAAGNKPNSMTLNMSHKTIDLNSTYQIKVKTVKPKKASKAVSYKTSNSKIASVSAKGIVKGKKEGTVKITVQSKANKKLKKTVKITVKRLRPYSLSLNKQKLNLQVGENTRLIATVKARSSVVWASADPEIVAVDKNGKVIAKKDGTTTITVKTLKKSYNGKALVKTCKVTVTHTHNYVTEKYVKATCTENGYEDLSCTICKDSQHKVLSATGHDYKITAQKAATCTEDGYKTYQCSRCEKTEKTTLPAIGHKQEKQKEDLEYVYYKCQNCGEEKKEYNDKEYTIDLGNGKTDTIIGHYDLEMPKEMLDICNEKRDLFEVNQLTMVNANTKLQKYANIRATEIAYYYTTTHYRPNGEYVLDSKDMIGISAENIVPGGNAQIACKALFSSPIHNETIVSNSYRSIAISTFCRKKDDGSYNHLFVQLFSTGKADWWNTNL